MPKRPRSPVTMPCLIIPFVLAFTTLAFAGGAGTKPLLPGYTTSWIGNSFNGAGENGYGRWMQIFIDEIDVSPDGSVITAHPWDEAGRCTGIYKDGDTNTNLLKVPEGPMGEEAWGWGTGSKAVAVEGNRIIICNTADRIIEFEWNPENISKWGFVRDKSIVRDKDDKKDEVIGLDADGGHVAAVWANGDIQVYERDTLKPMKTFRVQGAKDAAFDTKGNLWVIQGTRIKRFTPEGKVLPQSVTGLEKPTALSVSPQGKLVVCEDGKRQQVLVYDGIDTRPRLEKAFGAKGGLRSGTPGEAAPDKLFSLRGAGLDAEGNLYVAMGTGEAVIRKFGTDGSLKWELGAYHFIDAATFDPDSDGTMIFGVDEAYGIDYDKSPGKQWTLKAITRDSATYPNDPRNRRDVVSNVWTRVIKGRRILYVNGMYSQNSTKEGGLDVYGFEPGGSMTARFAGSFSGSNWAWDVDSWGSIWEGDSYGYVRRYPLKGFDAKGMPIYDTQTYNEYDTPEMFTKVMRIKYMADTDTMYISGFTEDHPEVSWGSVGAVVHRFRGWKKGNRTPDLQILLPQDGSEENLYPASMDIAGDYLFAVECKSAVVHVYSLKDGKEVGTMAPGREVGGKSGWIDIPCGLRAVKRSNGEYVVLVEEDWRGKNILYRWTPTDTKRD